MHLCESYDSTYDRYEKGLVMLLFQSQFDDVVCGSCALHARKTVATASADYI